MMQRRFKWVALGLALLIVCSLIATSTRKTSAQEREVKMSENAARQINSLIQEKESRTSAQKKIDSQLLYAAKENRGERISSEVSTLEVNVNADEKGFVPVDIQANVTRDLLKSIAKLGGEIVFASSRYHSVTARLPLQALEQIAASEDVNFIYPADRARTHAFRGFGADNTDGTSSTVKVNPLLKSALRPDFADRAARVRKQLSAALALRKPGRSALLMVTGPVNSEGDTTHRAAEARSFFGVSGSAVKVGVLSNGVSSLASQQAAGELPAVTVLPGQAGSGDEGTAMLEIVNDLAPGAQLFFATANTSQASFAQNILDLRAAGCDIIVDDVGYFREAVFADDNVARSVNTVTAAGALYFSSAGNEGNKDDNTSGVWEGDFVDSGTGTAGTVTVAGGTFHNFGGGVTNDQLTAANGGSPIGLFWSDPLAGSGNDYDLYILDAGLATVVNAATNVQDGNDDPVELSTISPAAGRRLLIFKKTGAALRALHLNTFRGRLAISTTGQTHGHSAAAAAFSVGATPAAGAIGAPPNPTGPFPGPFNSGNVSELFSSDGPRRVFFNPDGTPVTPGNFLFANGGVVRQKPDITAADGTASAVPGFNPFFGSSAAAPHAAAIAALLKSAGSFTPAQIRTALTSSAIDIEAAGVDRDTGAGIIMAFQALQAIGATPVPNIASAGTTLVNESCPPANNAVDPNEQVTLSLNLTNNGGAATTNLVATLQSSTNVIAPSGPQSYGIIAPAASAARDFSFTAAGVCGSNITLTLQLQDGTTNLGTVTFTITLGAIQTTGPTTFSNPTSVVIPTSGAATPYPSSIVVSGLTGTISKVTVNLKNLSHTFPGDVGMLLVGPGGQKFVMLDGVIGGSPWVNINYTLSDTAAGFIPNTGTPMSGTFKPTAYFPGDVFPAPAPPGPNQDAGPAGAATFASVFNGGNPNGTWSLYVFDFSTGDSGSIAGGWDLSITTSTAVCTTPCKANQTITFGALGSKTFGDPDFAVSATATSGLAVSLAASGNCTVTSPSPGTVHITGAGSCTITASQAGDANFNPAANVPQSFTINKANQTITFNALANKTFGDPDFSVSATATSGLSVSLAASGNCTVTTPSPGTVHLTAAGSCTITASQAGDSNFNAATNVPQSFTINKANQTITFNPLANKTFGNPDFAVSATASSGLAVSLAVSGNCTVTTPSPGTAHITGAGSCTITASQAGDANFNPATNVPQSFNIAKAGTSTAVASSVNPSDFGQNVTFTATVTSGAGTPTGSMQFKDNGTNLGAPVALNASAVALLNTSALTAGTHTITAEYSGDTNFLPSVGTLAGGQAAVPALSIKDVSTTEGNTGTKTLTFTVTLSAASNLTVTVNFATADDTATAGSDYVATSGTLIFNPGETAKDIPVTINGDIIVEGSELFRVHLSNPTNATIVNSVGSGIILNDDVPPGGFISFSQFSTSVGEATGIVTLTVVRTTDVSKAVNVDYATHDEAASTDCSALNTGLASQRCDFTSVFGTLKFAANETQKTIDVPINLDGYSEGDETFIVSLSNPTGGAVLAAPAGVLVTITDSASPTPNAIDDTTTFVRQQYRDFLNREADPAGLAFWKDNIDKCNDPARRPANQTVAQCIEVQRIVTSAAFFLSIEFKQTGGAVRDLYVAALDRPLTNNMPNFVEFMRDTQVIQKGVIVGPGNWQQVLDANRTAFVNEFVTRAEFVGLYPTTDTPTQYVDKLFLHAGVTPANPAERNAAIAEFGGAGTAADPGARGRALLRVTQNAAFQAREMNRMFVQIEYFGYLRRNPNDAPDNNFNGFNFWVNKLNQFNGDFMQAEMVKAFLSSIEYRKRFGP